MSSITPKTTPPAPTPASAPASHGSAATPVSNPSTAPGGGIDKLDSTQGAAAFQKSLVLEIFPNNSGEKLSAKGKPNTSSIPDPSDPSTMPAPKPKI